MPEQLHQGWKANAEPQHFCGKAVSQAVRDHMANATGALGGLGQRRSESLHHNTVPSIAMWQKKVF
jgi:hypothetical protein